MASPNALTSFQIEVAHLFFDLPKSGGFLLAGGAALNAQQLISRPTQDLDFFVAPNIADIASVCEAFTDAITGRGWTAETKQHGETFCRLIVRADEDLLVDIAVDSPPLGPPTMSIAGPTFEPIELAGRKLVALFDRAEARDFADVYALAQRYSTLQLLDAASRVDPGFQPKILADMVDSLTRFKDNDLPVDAHKVPVVRAFFRSWSSELRLERTVEPPAL